MKRTYTASIEHRADGTVGLTVYRFVPGGKGEEDEHERHEFALTHEDAWHLLGNLTGVLRVQSAERVRNTAAGDCETCGNLRMVEVEKHGRPWQEHCPDCRERYVNATPAYPSWPDPEESA